MAEEKIVPKLRISKYKDNWNKYKIGECFKERTENMPDGELLSVTKNNGIKKFSELGRHDNSNDDKSKYKKVCVGDIAYNSMRMWQGASGYSSYEGIVSPAYTVLCPNDVVDSKFASYLFKRPEMIHEFQLNSQGITSDTWNLKYPALSEIEIALARDINEQRDVAKYFSNLDQLIILYKEEYEKLVVIKEALLQKMFPQKGEYVPEIRFKEFTTHWEKHKVGEYYDFKNGLNKGKEFFGEGTPIVNFTDVYHSRGLCAERLVGKVALSAAEIKNYEVKQGDVFFTRTSETIDEIGYPSVMLDVPKNTVFSGFVLRGRAIDVDPLENVFKKYVFFTNVFRGEMIKKSSMTTRALTSGTAIKDMEFMYPIDKKEQVRIGEYFTNLDELIELQKMRIEKIVNIKAGCLENMFI